MVLINMDQDLNVVNKLGYTPLFLAHSNSTKEIIELLTDNKAKMHVDRNSHIPVSRSILDVYPEPSSSYKLPEGKQVVEDRNFLQEHLQLPNIKDYF
jgi:hypothetical protein